MIIRSIVVSGILLNSISLVSMEPGYWVSWNEAQKTYEYKVKTTLGCKQRADLDNKLQAAEQARRSKKEDLTDPQVMKPIMQAAKAGSSAAQQKVIEALKLTQNQCVTLEYLVRLSVDAQYQKNYGAAFDNLRKIRNLLLDTDEKTKAMMKDRGNCLRCYDNLLVDLNATYYLAQSSDDKSHQRSIDLKTHYLKCFASMLKLIHK